jgi:hypothetical protein
MDGAAGEASANVHRCLLSEAEVIFRSVGGVTVAQAAHDQS